MSDAEKMAFLCDPCSSIDVRVSAEGYCEVCKEYLCETCLGVHQRQSLTRSHPIKDKTRWTNEGGVALPDSCVEMCKTHSTEIVKYFCKDHTQAGCGDCMVINHTTCKKVMLQEVSKDIKESEDFKTVQDGLKKISEELMGTQETIDGHLEAMTYAHSDIIQKIDSLAAKISTYLENMKHQIKQQAGDMKQTEENNLRQLGDKNQTLKSDVDRLQTRLQTSTKNTNSLFQVTMEIKDKMSWLEKEVEHIQQDITKRHGHQEQIKFIPSTGIEKLLADNTPLGQLSYPNQQSKPDNDQVPGRNGKSSFQTVKDKGQNQHQTRGNQGENEQATDNPEQNAHESENQQKDAQENKGKEQNIQENENQQNDAQKNKGKEQKAQEIENQQKEESKDIELSTGADKDQTVYEGGIPLKGGYNDTTTSFVFSSTLLTDDKLVVTDFNNKSVKLIDLCSNTVLDSYYPDYNYYRRSPNTVSCVAAIDSTQVAVTRNLKNVDKTITKAYEIQVSEDCWGIAYKNMKLVVLHCGPNPIEIMNMNGVVLHSIRSQSIHNLFSPNFVAFGQDDKSIIVQNLWENEVHFIAFNGLFLHTYRHPELQEPSDVQVTKNGYILIGSSKNDCIHVLSPDLRTSRIILKKDVNFKHPWSFAYSEKRKKLYVGGVMINVFDLKDECIC